MGDFKPLLPFGDSTVIDHCIRNFVRAGIESIVVVAGHRAEDLKRHLRNSPVTVAVNPDPATEMSTSIGIGVRAVPRSAKAVVITPADHPGVRSEVISQLIGEWQKGARLVVPTWNERGGHPVVVDLHFRERLLALDPDRGLRALFDELESRVKRVPVQSPFIARDMDTWDDYVALHEDIFGFPPKKS
jgi:molybdenum cofactor cytidylyltransferase